MLDYYSSSSSSFSSSLGFLRHDVMDCVLLALFFVPVFSLLFCHFALCYLILLFWFVPSLSLSFGGFSPFIGMD